MKKHPETPSRRWKAALIVVPLLALILLLLGPLYPVIQRAIETRNAITLSPEWRRVNQTAVRGKQVTVQWKAAWDMRSAALVFEYGDVEERMEKSDELAIPLGSSVSFSAPDGGETMFYVWARSADADAGEGRAEFIISAE